MRNLFAGHSVHKKLDARPDLALMLRTFCLLRHLPALADRLPPLSEKQLECLAEIAYRYEVEDIANRAVLLKISALKTGVTLD